MDSPILHVVYAGYGDSLLLEYTHGADRRIIIVDGGPKCRSPIAHLYAPYSEYFASAAQEIWSEMRQRVIDENRDGRNIPNKIFSPTAIINSHPDHDHYEGLLELVKNYVPKTWSRDPVDGQKIFFNGPYLLPRPRSLPKPRQVTGNFLPDEDWKGARDGIKKHLLTERNFKEQRWNQSPQKPYGLLAPQQSIPGVSIMYPTIRTGISFNMLVYSREDPNGGHLLEEIPAGDGSSLEEEIMQAIQEEKSVSIDEEVPSSSEFSLLLGDQIGVNHQLPELRIKIPKNVAADESATNVSSILLMLADNARGDVILTGDSIASRIEKYCIEPHRNLNVRRPHIEIFKIQHHGSINNGLLNGDLVKFEWNIAIEVALRELMELQWGGILNDLPGRQESGLDSFYSASLSSDITAEKVVLATNILATLFWDILWPKKSGVQRFTSIIAKDATNPFTKVVTDFANMKNPDRPHEAWVFQTILFYLNYLRQRHAKYLECFKFIDKQWEMRDFGETVKNFHHFDELAPDAVMMKLIRTCEANATAAMAHVWIPPKPTAPEEPAGTKKPKKSKKLPPVELYHVDSFYDCRLSDVDGVTKLLVLKDWWSKWGGAAWGGAMSSWLGLYTSLRSVGLAMAFYRTFTADAYVVSANGSHGHPSPAILLAIILVTIEDYLKDSTVVRTFFATLGHALPAGLVQQLARYICHDEFCPIHIINQALALGGCISIRYLAKGTYMSLNGEKGRNGGALRDLKKTTEHWIPDTINPVTESAYHELEGDKTVLPMGPHDIKLIQFKCGRRNEDPVGILNNPPKLKPVLLNGDPDMKLVFKVSQEYDSRQMINQLLLYNMDGTEVIHAKYKRIGEKAFQLYFQMRDGDTLSYYSWYYDAVNPVNEPEWIDEDEVRVENEKLYDMVSGKAVLPMVFHAFQVTQVVPKKTNMFGSLPFVAPGNSGAHAVDNFLVMSGVDISNTKAAPVPRFHEEALDVSSMQTLDTEEWLSPTNPEQMQGMRDAANYQINASMQTSNLVLEPQIATIQKVAQSSDQSGTSTGPSSNTLVMSERTLDQFFKDSMVSAEQSSTQMTVQKLLETTVGLDNFVKFNFSLAIERHVLGYHVNKASSVVRYDVVGSDTRLLWANIQILKPVAPLVSIGGEDMEVSGCSLILEWAMEKPLTAKITLSLEDGDTSLEMTREIDAKSARRTASLAKLLSNLCNEAGIEPELRSLGFAKAFAYLSGRTYQGAASFLVSRTPRWLVKAGLLKARIDVNRSLVIAYPTPAGGMEIERGELICNISKLCDAANKLQSIAGLDMKFGDIKIVLLKPGRHDEVVTLEGKITISSVSLAFSVAMTKPDETLEIDAISWKFEATSTKPVADISSLWPQHKGTLEEVQSAPFTKSESPLTKLGHSGFGFIVSQPMAHISHYRLSNIFFITTLDDWKKYLPDNFVPEGMTVTGRLEVRNPFEKEKRMIGASVDFRIEVETADQAKRILKAALVAEPLTIHAYDYRLFISGSEEGVTAPEIGKKFGWEKRLESLAQSLPVIHDLIESLHLRHLVVTIHYEDKKLSLTDFILDLTIDQLKVAENLVIEDTLITLDYSSDIWSGVVKGCMRIGKKLVNVDVKLPLLHEQGHIIITAPNGLTVNNVLVSMSLQPVTGIPVICTLMDSELRHAVLVLDRTTSATSIVGFSFAFKLPKIPMDCIKITNLEIVIDRVKVPHKDGPATDLTAFSVQGTVADTLTITVSYNTAVKYLEAKLHAAKPTAVAVAMEQFLGPGAVSNALHDILGDLGVEHAVVAFDAELTKISAFSIHLVNTATIPVESVSLENLRLDFVAARPSRGGKPATPGFLTLTGSTKVEKDGPKFGAVFYLRCVWDPSQASKTIELLVEETSTASLTFRGALNAFNWKEPKSERPQGLDDDNAFDLSIHRIAGQVGTIKEPGKKSRMSLTALDIIVEKDTTAALSMLPNIKLDAFALAFHHRKLPLEAAPSLNANVWAMLTLYDNIHVTLKYVVIRVDKVSIQEFCGSVTRKVESTNPKRLKQKVPVFKDLAIKYLEFDPTPDGIGLPKDIPLSEFTVRYQPKRKFEIYGHTTELAWPFKIFGDLDISVTGLGGRLVVLMPKEETKALEEKDKKTANPAHISPHNNEKVVDATLYGALRFGAFTSAEAVLHISNKKRPVLRAYVWKSTTDGKEIQDLTAKISKKQDTWAGLLPSTTKPISFGTAELRLVIDFATKIFVLTGFIEGVGHAVLLIQKNEDGHCEYVFNVVLTNIYALWPELKGELEDHMTFEVITVQISSFEVKISAIKEALALLVPGKLENGISEPKAEMSKPGGIEEATKSGSSATQSLAEQTIALNESTENLKPEASIPKGVVIHAVLGIGKSGPINEMLKASTTSLPAAYPRISLSAIIHKEKTVGNTYTISMTDFPLLGNSIVLSGGTGTYITAPEHTLRIDVKLQLKFDKDHDPFSFNATFTADALKTTFEVVFAKKPEGTVATPETTKTQTSAIKNPFGGMFGLSLEVEKFKGSITKPVKSVDGSVPVQGTSSYDLSGTIVVAGHPLTANLFFIGGSPKLIVLQTTPTLTMAQVYSDILNLEKPTDATKQIEWPKDDFDVLQLNKVLVYYSREDNSKVYDGDTRIYQSGFNILAEIELFTVAFEISVHIPQDRSGVSITGSPVHEVALGFAQLTKKPVKAGDTFAIAPGGPEVTIRSMRDKLGKQEKSFTLSTGITILDTRGFSADLSYIKGGGFVGSATYTGKILVLNCDSPTVTVAYKNGKFSIGGLPVKTDMALDIAKALREAPRPDCPSLLKLLFDKKTKTHFDYELDLLGVDTKENKVNIGINGTFTVTLDVIGTTLHSVTFNIPMLAKVPLHKPTGTELLQILFTTITDNIGAIGTAILAQPHKAATIIAWMKMSDFADEVIAALVCRGLDPEEVYNRGWDLRPENHPDPNKHPLKWWQILLIGVGVIVVGVGIWVAIDFLIAYGLEYASYYLLMKGRQLMLKTIVRRLALLVAGGATGLAVTNLAKFTKSSNELNTVLDNAAKTLADTKLEVRKWLNLTEKPVVTTSAASGGLKVDWTKGVPKMEGKMPADVAKRVCIWEIIVRTENKPPANDSQTAEIDVYETTSTSIEIHKESLNTAPAIYTWVRARYEHPKMVLAAEKWTACDVILPIPRLPAPHSLIMSVSTDKLNILLRVPEAAAGIYECQLYVSPEGRSPQPTDALTKPAIYTIVAPNSCMITLPITDLDWYYLMHTRPDLTRKLHARIIHHSPDTKAKSSLPIWSNPLSVHPAPTALDVAYSSDTLHLTWKSDTPAKEAELLFKISGKIVKHLCSTLPLSLPTVDIPLVFEDNIEVYFRQRASTSLPDTVPLFARYNISTPPTLTITKPSFLDMGTQTLELTISLSRPSFASQIQSFAIHSSSSSELTPDHFLAPIYIHDFKALPITTTTTTPSTSHILLHIPLLSLPSPLPPHLSISILDQDFNQQPPSAPWVLPHLILTSAGTL